MAHKGPKNPERGFGLSVGTVLLLIAAYGFWRGRMTMAAGFGAVGFVLVTLGYLRPSWLYYPSKAWWRFAIALGYVNARIILTVAFAIVLTPDLDDLALDRPRSAAAAALQLARVVAVSGALPQRRAFQEDVLEDLMAKSRVLKEFWQFLMAEKKYWLLPIVIVFVLFGLLIVFSQSSAVAPFIYTLF